MPLHNFYKRKNQCKKCIRTSAYTVKNKQKKICTSIAWQAERNSYRIILKSHNRYIRDNIQRKCTSCGKTKTLNFFHKKLNSTTAKCKKCCSEISKKRNKTPNIRRMAITASRTAEKNSIRVLERSYYVSLGLRMCIVCNNAKPINNFDRTKYTCHSCLYKRNMLSEDFRLAKNIYNRKRNEMLSDAYVRGSLKLKKDDCPKGLIEAKRELMKLNRLIHCFE